MGSTLRRAAFALRFGEYNLLGSGLINKDSRILYIRDVEERVQMLAPFLDFDDDPYPVITNGRLVWVIDGYTTSSRYPYAENADNDELAAGSGLRPHLQLRAELGEGRRRRLRRHRHLLRRRSERPDRAPPGRRPSPGCSPRATKVPPELAAHFRYPEDLFRVQTNMYGRYHINDPDQFFQRDSSGASPRSRRRPSIPAPPRSRRPARRTGSRPPARARPASTRTTRSSTSPGSRHRSSRWCGRSCRSRRTTSGRTSSR